MMQIDWIPQFSLFLFDFDGLLVDTERTHYQAYMDVLIERNSPMSWSFDDFCILAHLDGSSLRGAITARWPQIEVEWDSFYREKKRRYLALIQQGQASLMPGVEEMLQYLASQEIPRVVVTNSPMEQILVIRSFLPILNTIPYWITREDYTKPKPDPECYLQAIDLYSKPGGLIIGFEDSIRGLEALKKTPALPVLICPLSHPLLKAQTLEGVLRFDSFLDIRM